MTPDPEPPYRRIADEIRRRITSGGLAPGDRVPSTRQIVKDWGVALATATKALTTLRLEGYVETRPRIGTVVATRTPAPAPKPSRHAAPPSASHDHDHDHEPELTRDHELTRDRIVRAAMHIADTEGLSGLSMRGVAARLGVAAMSPYRYVKSKDDLILLMADAAFGEETYPATPPEGWRARLELCARTLWRVYRRHPWLAQLAPLSRPLVLPNLMVHAECALSALDGHGLEPATMMDVHVLLYSYVQGLAVSLEQEAQAEAATGLTEDEWMADQVESLRAIAGSTGYPVFAKVTAALADGYDLDLDVLFEFGLGPLLDGFAGIVEGPPGP
ncbi:TetR/AcrR family transcriptional regulator C-terminal domain-containing protein [Streptomyces sp. NBC_01433]|uniref:TetR/AcrR family transcriptional regulator C-terminal domain-containing protein n=1 Tax=Streptomyces sp. NBC_01433 TaxID=2903864 RepID=UPI00224DD2E0|nr:TetR/AcrR family transcriptional regulator C-terminal domain-containing protein [Streptomyces sp. NBC_01433]MCX4675492.1 TetR/AcrR family transcriptional regulator C-terminal domain-containing protein [Streptomyces sp. NBC_01433]